MAIIIYSFSDLYNKYHIKSVYNVTGRKLNHLNCHYKFISVNNLILKIELSSSFISGRIFDWRLSQPGFDPSFGNLACLAKLMSSDGTKQICHIYAPLPL